MKFTLEERESKSCEGTHWVGMIHKGEKLIAMKSGTKRYASGIFFNIFNLIRAL